MNTEQKQSRLKELSKEKFLSDEELNEKASLEEELSIIHQEETKINEPIKLNDIKPVKRTIAQVIMDKLKKKPEEPATWKEIEQLKLEYHKAKLLQGIAKTKADTPQKQTGLAKLASLFTPMPTPKESGKKSHKSKTKRSKPYTESDHEKFKGLISNDDDPHKYDRLR